MILLGMTGSIGMGKTTTAGLFRRFGISVFDADRCVHDLYDGPIAAIISEMFPGSVSDGRVDRKALGALVLGIDRSMARLEAVVHPMVMAKRTELSNDKRGAEPDWLFWISLSYSKPEASTRCDAIIVVTASLAEQRRRVLARPGMNEHKLAAILDRQIPDREKRKQAHFIVQTISLDSLARADQKDHFGADWIYEMSPKFEDELTP